MTASGRMAAPSSIRASSAGSEPAAGQRAQIVTSEPTDTTQVKASPIEGLGIFARRQIKAGESIRALQYEREVTPEAPLRPEAGERPEHCTYTDGRTFLVAFPDRHMNHSCDPSAYYVYGKNGEVVSRARRDILAGEEITVDYLINNPGGNSWPCQCGSGRCRGETGVSYFTLPREIQQEYLPLLAPWFKAQFADQIAALEQGSAALNHP